MLGYGRSHGGRVGHRDGFAVISALLILVAIGTLAAGAGTLSFMNLRAAQNAQLQAIAEFRAEEGLDVALIVLAQLYVLNPEGRENPLALPQESVLRQWFEDYEGTPDYRYRLVRFDTPGPDPDSGELVVEGFVQREDGAFAARHVVTARVSARTVTGDRSVLQTRVGPGLVSPGIIRVNGEGRFRLNVHAGLDFLAGGTGYAGFTYVAGVGRECGITKFEDPETGETLEGSPSVECGEGGPPVVPEFEWESVHEAYQDVACTYEITAMTGSLNRLDADFYSGAMDESIVCVDDGLDVTFSSGTLRNVTIVGGPNTTVRVAVGSEASAFSESSLGVRIIAQDVELVGAQGNRPSTPLSGENEIYARGNVRLDRGVTATETTPDGQLVVGTTIQAGRDVVHRGDGNSGIAAFIKANRRFCRGGGGNFGTFTGTIEVADIDVPTSVSQFSGSGAQWSCGNNVEAIRVDGAGRDFTFRIPTNADTTSTTTTLDAETVADAITVLQRR